jgi:hypothetical protein
MNKQPDYRLEHNTDSQWNDICTQVLEKAANDTQQEDVVRLLARILPRFVQPALYQKYFRLWEAAGFHLTPVHFYQPLPDTESLPEDLWRKSSTLKGIEMNDAVQLDLLCKEFPRYRAEYEKLPLKRTDCDHEFYLDNPLFGGTDALALYCMVRHLQPRLVIEVGCGFSTRLTAQAALRNGQTELIAIEPFPDAMVKKGFPGLTALVPRCVQEVGLDTFRTLSSGDILFLDSSHVARCGSDVNFLFLEVLPHLPPGVIIHIHDIFLPNEYPREWVKQEFRFWNEQYLLQAFLMFNKDFEVLLANNYLAQHYQPQMQSTFPASPWLGGGSFWMRRKPGPQHA